MNLTPTPGRLIVKVDPEADQTAGGIYLPATAIQQGNYGTVVACSPHAYYDDRDQLSMPHVRKGDRVVIGRYSGVGIDYEGEDYVVLKQDEILAVVDQVPVG